MSSSLLLAAELPEVGPATGAAGLAWLLVALPAVGVRWCCCSPGAGPTSGATSLGALAVVAAFVVRPGDLLRGHGPTPPRSAPASSLFTTGSRSAGLHVDVGLRIDPLSLTFVLLITGVGSLIHIYAVGYMAARPEDRRRFFGYFNLFIAAMLLLVLGNSFVLLYVGWEGVGLASYLLIGFYYDRPSAATAAKKAFLINRVGDVGLSIAIMLMFDELGTTAVHRGLRATSGGSTRRALAAIALLLLLGACGKSGQFPLQTWLPDAMEGPTPVSALIHAATMVTAGRLPDRPLGPDLRPDADRPHRSSRSSARSPCSTAASAAAPRTTSRRCWPTRRSARSATCSWPSGSARAATRSASSTCSATASSRPRCSSSAGSVMHAMNDDVDMRRFGGLCAGHADHLRRVRPAATSRSSASRRSPASSPRTRSSRRRSPRAGRQGWTPRPRRPARRRPHRVLHDPR